MARIVNVHERLVRLGIAEVRPALASLATREDRLWPVHRWPAMRLSGPLAAGARGGHGPVRYTVESVADDEVVFRFERPFPFVGTHRFSLTAEGPGATTIRHELTGEPVGAMRVAWPLLVGPLHDALIEDAFDRLSLAAGEPARQPRLSRSLELRRAVLVRLTRRASR